MNVAIDSWVLEVRGVFDGEGKPVDDIEMSEKEISESNELWHDVKGMFDPSLSCSQSSIPKKWDSFLTFALPVVYERW